MSEELKISISQMPKWLRIINRIAILFGLHVTLYSEPQLLSKILDKLTFVDPMQSKHGINEKEGVSD